MLTKAAMSTALSLSLGAGLLPVMAQEEPVVLIVNDSETGTGINQFQFSSGWVHEGGYPDRFEGGDEHWTTKTQFGNTLPSFKMTFLGRKISLYGHKTKPGCMADVLIDGVKAGTIDYYNASRVEKVLLYESAELENGEHTIEVRLNGEKNEAAGDTFEAAIDYARIESETSDYPATGITLDRTSGWLEEGMSLQLHSTITPSYATQIPNVIYTSSDPETASVDADGTVHALKPGSAEITAALEGTEIQASCTFTVAAASELLSGWTADANVHNHPNTYLSQLERLVPESLSKSDGFTLWKNDEYITRIDFLTKAEAIPGAKLKTSIPTDEAGHTIPAENVSLTWMHAPWSHDTNKDIYDVITRETEKDLPAMSLEEAWLSVKTDENTEPGTYTMKAWVEADDEVLQEFTYTLEVLDLTIPEFSSQIELWMYPYSSNRYYSGQDTNTYFGDVTNLFNVHLDPQYDDALENQLDLYKKIGGDAITVTVVEEAWNHQTHDSYPSMVKWTRKADGTFSFDYSDFDKWVQMNLDHGIDGQIKSFSLSCWGNRIVYFDEASGTVKSIQPATGSETWTEFWSAFLRDYVAHLEEKGWFDMTYMAMDERPLNEVKPVLDLVESVTNEEGKHLKTSLAVYDYGCESVFDRIDDLSFAIYVGSQAKAKEIAADRKEKGLMTTIYTCGAQNSAMTNNPGESTASILEAWKDGTDGFLRWAFDSFNADPLSSSYHTRFASGDLFLVYPDAKDSEERMPQTTPRYEKLVQGVRDYEKLKYLSETYPWMADKLEESKSRLGYDINIAEKTIASLSKQALEGEIIPHLEFDAESITLAPGESHQAVLSSKPEGLLDELLHTRSVINDYDPAITWIGAWTGEQGYPELFENGDDHWCETTPGKAGEKGYEFDFTGNGFRLMGNLEHLSGILSITIDDQEPVEADTYGPGKVRFSELFNSGELPYGMHHVKVVNSGKKNPASDDYNMQLDYIETWTTNAVTWSSDNEGAASVDENGLITAHTPGQAVITASLGDYSVSIQVTTAAAESADKRLLEMAIAHAESLKAQNALEGVNALAVRNFESALSSAIAIRDDASLSQEKVDAAWKELAKAIHMLSFKTDFSALNALIAECEAIDLDTVPDGAEKDAFIAALEQAKETAKSPTALTDVSIAQAIAALQTAKDALPEAVQVDTTLLAWLVSQTENTDLSLYMSDGHEAFEQALSHAGEVLEAPASQQAVDEALDALSNAWLNLRLKADENLLQQLRDFIEQAAGLDKTAYTAESWNTISSLNDRAKALLAAEEVSAQDAEKLISEIHEVQKLIANPDAAKSTLTSSRSADQGTAKSASVKTAAASGLTGWIAVFGAAILGLLEAKKH